MAKAHVQDEDPPGNMNPGHYDVIIIVDDQERPDGEEVKYDLQKNLENLGKNVKFHIMDSRELSSASQGLLLFQRAVEEGKIVLAIFTQRFVSNRACLNALYRTIIKQMKEHGNANFFKPVFFDNPKRARYTPVQFCNFRSFWWERDRDKETLAKVLSI